MAIIEQDKALDLIAAGKDAWNKRIIELRGPYEQKNAVVEIVDYDFGGEDLDGFNFSCNITFRNCTFRSKQLFNNVKKIGMMTFKDCPEIGRINMEGVEIYQFYILTTEPDNDPTRIQGFSIGGSDTAVGTIFIQNAVVLNELCLRDVNRKDDQIFTPFIYVESCKVHGDVCLEKSRFKANFLMHSCEFMDCFQAKESWFGSRPKFTNCNFHGLTDFRRATFVRPPYFDGATLHPHTLFPPENNFKITKRGKEDDIDEDIEALRTLRHHSARLLNRHLQGEFYSLEQKYRQISGRMTKTEYFFSQLYRLVSNYGRSMIRPMVGIIFLIVIFTTINALINSSELNLSYNFDETIIKEATITSLQNTFVPFRNLVGANKETHLSITILGIFHSLFAVGLFSSFLLALRWNFKKD